MKPPAFSLFAPYLCKTPSLWVSCESLCVCFCACVLTNLLHVSHLLCCRSPPRLSSPSRPHFFLLLLLFFFFSPLQQRSLSKSCLLPPLPFILSLDTGFLQGKNSIVHFVSLSASIDAPPLPSFLFILFLSLLFFSSFLSLSTEGFGTNLLKFPICTACLSVAYHRWSFVLFAQKKQRRSRTGKERMHSKKRFNHTQTQTAKDWI